MTIKICIKQGKSYIQRIINHDNNIDKKFFQSLLLNVDEQLILIRNHITSFFTDGNVNLKRPSHPDWEINIKIKKLIKLRKINLIAKDKIKEIIQEHDYITCKCGAKMYREPIDIPFKKFGKNYLLPSSAYGVKYQYACTSCSTSTNEIILNKIIENKNRRKNLLESGYNWVPNDYGFWHWKGEGDKKHHDSI